MSMVFTRTSGDDIDGNVLRHDIGLEYDDGVKFDDLLEKALVLIGCRKRLAYFVEEKKSTWTFTNPRKDQPTAQVNHHNMPPIVFPPTPTTPDIIRPFTSTTRDSTPMVRSVPVTRVTTVEWDNDCGLIPASAKNILEDPSAIFADCGSVEEEKMQVGVHLIGVVKLSKHSSNASRGGPYCFSVEAIDGTRMSATGRISARERRSRLGNLLISDRPMKYKDHG